VARFSERMDAALGSLERECRSLAFYDAADTIRGLLSYGDHVWPLMREHGLQIAAGGAVACLLRRQVTEAGGFLVTLRMLLAVAGDGLTTAILRETQPDAFLEREVDRRETFPEIVFGPACDETF